VIMLGGLAGLSKTKASAGKAALGVEAHRGKKKHPVDGGGPDPCQRPNALKQFGRLFGDAGEGWVVLQRSPETGAKPGRRGYPVEVARGQ